MLGEARETYRDVEERGFVQRPALDEVEEGLLRLLDVHADERLVVHGDVVLVYVHQDPGREAVRDHLAVVPVPGGVVAELDLRSQRA